MNAGLLGSGSEASLFSAQRGERAIDRAIHSEDALEHEEPTPAEAASNEEAPEHEEPK